MACTAPGLDFFEIYSGVFIFEKLFSKFILKFNWNVSTVRFKNVIHKLFRNSCHGQKSIGNCLSRNFTGCSCSGVVVQGELLRQKWGNFIESNFPGVNFPRRNYSGRYVLGLIAFEEISWEKLSGGQLSRGNPRIPVLGFTVLPSVLQLILFSNN